ncbi:MAG: YjbQ family protein [Methylobacter sp.]|nr:YjbQ family protein [Methylobacter sp.]
MSAHIKNFLLGSSISIPVTDGAFNLGTWQGIYLSSIATRTAAEAS